MVIWDFGVPPVWLCCLQWRSSTPPPLFLPTLSLPADRPLPMRRATAGVAAALPPQLAWAPPLPTAASPSPPPPPSRPPATAAAVAAAVGHTPSPPTMAPFRLGVVTDVQYAAKLSIVHPHPPPAAVAVAAAAAAAGAPPLPPPVRDYSAALPRLAAALSAVRGGVAGAGVGAVVHLGDLIDGHEGDAAASAVDLDAVLAVFDDACGRGGGEGSGGGGGPIPVLHVVGNHCLTAGRAAVMGSRAFWGDSEGGRGGVAAAVTAAGGSLCWGDAPPAAPPAPAGSAAADVDCVLSSPSPRVGYYEVTPPGATGWRLLVLDTMAVSVAYRADDARRAAGEAALAAFAATGAAAATKWNGAVGAEQRRWLERRLAAAAADGVQVLVCGHHPLVREAAVRFSLGGRGGGGGWGRGLVAHLCQERIRVPHCLLPGLETPWGRGCGAGTVVLVSGFSFVLLCLLPSALCCRLTS